MHLVGFIKKKFVTMHNHMNVKLVIKFLFLKLPFPQFHNFPIDFKRKLFHKTYSLK